MSLKIMMIFGTYNCNVFILSDEASEIMLNNSSYNEHLHFVSDFNENPIRFHCEI